MKLKRINKILIITLVMAFAITLGTILNTGASVAKYTVHRLKREGNTITYSATIGNEFTNFNEALALMNAEAKKEANVVIKSSTSRSPNKIVASDRAIVQSFPYRNGNRSKQKTTLDIYPTQTSTSARTYIPAHYTMFYYGSFSTTNGLVADVEINGGRGFVDMDKIDIIPLIYVDNGLPIEIGGNQDYSASNEKSYSMVVKADSYEVVKGNPYNEIKVNINRTHPTIKSSSSTYGIAPSWLVPGKEYYSPDGITFYEDIAFTRKVSNNKFYAYFQWLPLRTATNHTAAAFDDLLRYYNKHDSVILDESYHFIEQGLNYGMNPVLIFSQANLESAYGTSKYAKDRNNLFGWGAVDSNPDNAKGYANIGEGIAVHMRTQLPGYTHVGDFRHFGTFFGNKGAGFSVKYASDPYYGMKVASLAYTLDKRNGYKDYNAYDLSVLNDGTSYAFKKNASASSGNWYSSKSGQKNQVIINYGLTNNFLKTALYTPNDGTTNQPGYWPMNLFTEFAYIANNANITKVDKHGPTNNKVPTKPSNWTPPSKTVTFEKTAQSGLVTDKVNLRDNYTDVGSNVIGSVPKGTKVQIYLGSNGWGRITYDNKTGYILADSFVVLLDEGTPPNPGNVTVSDKAETATTTDSLRLRENHNTSSSILTTIPSGTKLTVYRTSNGWAKVTYNGQTGYVSQEYLKFDTKPIDPPKPQYPQGDVDMSGAVKTRDVVLVRQYLLGKSKLSAEQLKLADMNGDSKIGTADVVLMRKILLGIK